MNDFYFISQRLIQAVADYLPNAEHRNCARHIYANFRKRFNGANYRKLFWMAAKSSTRIEFTNIMEKVKNLSDSAYTWLLNCDPHVWSRAFFATNTKCINVENNMSEAFNGFLGEAREKPILNLLHDIRLKVMGRVEKNMKEVMKNPEDLLCPRIRKKLEENKRQYRFWNCQHNNEKKFEISLGDIAYTVDMEARTCSCRMWQLSGILCPHAINAIYFLKDKPDKFVDEVFLKKTYAATYKHYMEPMNGQNMWPKSSMAPVLPPAARRLPGRPKKARRMEFHENPKSTGKLSRKGCQMKCSNCGKPNHNKSTCKISATEKPVLPKKKIGRPKGSVKQAPTNENTRKHKKKANMGVGVFTDPKTGKTYVNVSKWNFLFCFYLYYF